MPSKPPVPRAGPAPGPAPGAAPSPADQLMDATFFAHIRFSAAYAAARLGIPDALARGALTSDQVAAAVGANPSATYRLLRALGTFGVVEEGPGKAFALGPLGELLRSDVPGSLRDMVLMGGARFRLLPWIEAEESVRTGKPVFEKALGAPIFAWFPRHPEDAAVFDRSMTSLSGQQTEAVLQAYDFSPFRIVVDVGGGQGALLAAILRKHPGTTGAVYELPAVAEGARAFLAAQGLADRARAVGGDMFEAPPPPADAYVLKYILHDWTDDEGVRILRHLRQALRPGGRLVVVDTVLPGPGVPHPGKLLDLEMLVIPGGRERTEDEWRELLDRGGFKMVRATPLPGITGIVEGVPA